MIQGALLKRRLADVAYIYRAPVELRDGLRSALTIDAKAKLLARETLGPDILESYALTV